MSIGQRTELLLKRKIRDTFICLLAFHIQAFSFIYAPLFLATMNEIRDEETENNEEVLDSSIIMDPNNDSFVEYCTKTLSLERSGPSELLRCCGWL